jgi:hypothetical protein
MVWSPLSVRREPKEEVSSAPPDYADNFINGALTELGGQRTITAKSA